MELDLPPPVSLSPSRGTCLCSRVATGIPTLKNTFASIKKLSVKIVKSYIRMMYNSETNLFSHGESPNSFLRGIIHRQKLLVIGKMTIYRHEPHFNWHEKFVFLFSGIL
jgi:hypothetical protein